MEVFFYICIAFDTHIEIAGRGLYQRYINIINQEIYKNDLLCNFINSINYSYKDIKTKKSHTIIYKSPVAFKKRGKEELTFRRQAAYLNISVKINKNIFNMNNKLINMLKESICFYLRTQNVSVVHITTCIKFNDIINL